MDHLGNDFTVLGCSLCFAHIPKMPVFTDFLSTHVSPLSRSKKLFSCKTCTKRVKPGISPRLCHAFFRYVLSASEISKVLSKEKKERLRSFGLSLEFHDPVQQFPVSLPMPLDELSFHASLSVPESESFLNWLKSSQTVESISACMVSESKVTPRASRKLFAYWYFAYLSISPERSASSAA